MSFLIWREGKKEELTDEGTGHLDLDKLHEGRGVERGVDEAGWVDW